MVVKRTFVICKFWATPSIYLNHAHTNAQRKWKCTYYQNQGKQSQYNRKKFTTNAFISPTFEETYVISWLYRSHD